MRALHAVTLHTPSGTFGGPTRVALNLSSELRRRGIDARITALAEGFGTTLPAEVDGVPAQLFPSRAVLPRFEVSGITSPRYLMSLRSQVRAADVVHVHLMRDLVTVPAALAAIRERTPLVVQTHGMVDPTTKRFARLVDTVAVRKILHRADAVLCLTETERRHIDEVAGRPVATVHLPNGIAPVSPRPSLPQTPRVLFLARMQARKRPGAFVRAIPEIVAAHPDATFVVAGPDSGELEPTRELARALGVADRIEFLGALTHEQALAEFARTSVYVLPSFDEPFPLTVLESMSCGVPVVLTDTCGLAPAVRDAASGRVITHVNQIGDAVIELLDRETNERAAAAGRRLVQTSYSSETVVDRLVDVYHGALRNKPIETSEATL